MTSPTPDEDKTEQLKQGALLVRANAKVLEGMIVQLEKRLSDMPGRVEAIVAAEEFNLKFARKSKGWALFVAAKDANEWLLLVNARLTWKVAAAKLVWDLVAAMRESQLGLLSNVETACKEIAETLGKLPMRLENQDKIDELRKVMKSDADDDNRGNLKEGD